MTRDFIARALAWIDGDPDPEDRKELQQLISHHPEQLPDRFAGPLEFGTAGLRGLIGAGESRMNTAVVSRTTFGLCRHLIANVPNARERGIVVGRDGRRRSDAFAKAVVRVAAGLGFRVHEYPTPVPTPLVSFGVKHLNAAAGVAVTASHNPPEYNGYKVFRDAGAQIVPPEDGEIASWIAGSPRAVDIPEHLDATSSRIIDATYLEAEYLAALKAHPSLARRSDRPMKIAYTALHGVGERFIRAAMANAGFNDVVSVREQSEPDGSFPTVRFPNPEEPGALDLLLALAQKENADLAIANDPDADRLCVAVRNEAGGFTVLTGDEVGVLLGTFVLERMPGMVVSTVVSSTQLGRIARALGSPSAETLTGFKWIAHRGRAFEREGGRFAFGYEEALGYAVGGLTWDKDGVSAATCFAALADSLAVQGKSVLDHLFELRRKYGYHRSKQRSVVLPGSSGAEVRAAAMARLRSEPPKALGGSAVVSGWDLQARTKVERGRSVDVSTFPASDVLIYELEDGSRASVRPSGTEPKIKLYLEVIEDLASGRAPAEARAAARLDALIKDLSAAAGLPW